MCRQIILALFCFIFLSVVVSQSVILPPKFPSDLFSDDGSYENDELADYLPEKRAFSFQAARGKKSSFGEKRYSYLPSRG